MGRTKAVVRKDDSMLLKEDSTVPNETYYARIVEKKDILKDYVQNQAIITMLKTTIF